MKDQISKYQEIVQSLTAAAVNISSLEDEIPNDDESQFAEKGKLNQQKNQLTSLIGEYTVKIAELTNQDKQNS